MADSAMEIDDIDAENLQSQIDMSMSLVHHLVSSWVTPSGKTTKSTDAKKQKELEELMRRPPRLGVGATIPEAAAASRDAARLKNHLTGGKKRTRDEIVEDKKLSHSSDDEEDSRTAVVCKKNKPDPFAVVKKKESQPLGLMTPRETPTSSQNQSNDSLMSTAMAVNPPIDAAVVEPTSSPRKTKKKKKNSDLAKSMSSVPISPPKTPVGQVTQMNPAKASVSESSLAAETAVPTSIIKNTSLVVPSTPKFSLPARDRASSIMPAAFKIPLLNLDGPPPDMDERECDYHSASPHESAKKKRKRRKKKKKNHETADA